MRDYRQISRETATGGVAARTYCGRCGAETYSGPCYACAPMILSRVADPSLIAEVARLREALTQIVKRDDWTSGEMRHRARIALEGTEP